MNNSRKKAIALAAVVCVALTSLASCSKKESGADNKDSNTTTTASSVDGTSDGGTVDKPSAPADDLGQIKNEDGNAVITPFQSGSPEELVLTGLNTEDDSNMIEDSTSQNTDGSEYVSKTDKRYCLWIDISADPSKGNKNGVAITEDGYAFNDQIIKVTFKLKDNIPEKDYAVRFNPDFSTLSAQSVKPKVLQGNIRVGGDIEPQNVSSETGFVAYGDNVSAKPGDTVDYYINLKNNPGLAAMLVWVYYDSNAMDVQSVSAAGEYAKIAKGTQTGSAA